MRPWAANNSRLNKWLKLNSLIENVCTFPPNIFRGKFFIEMWRFLKKGWTILCNIKGPLITVCHVLKSKLINRYVPFSNKGHLMPPQKITLYYLRPCRLFRWETDLPSPATSSSNITDGLETARHANVSRKEGDIKMQCWRNQRIFSMIFYIIPGGPFHQSLSTNFGN